MGIRDDLARTHGGFIGLRDLLRALARSEHVDFQAAAAWLSRKLLEAEAQKEKPPAWRSYGPATGVLGTLPAQVLKARKLLEEFACFGDEATTFLDESGDADTLGFRVNEMTEYLQQRHGITLDLQPDSTVPVLAHAAQDWPDWCKALAARPLLSVYEAASALAGVDPRAPGYPSDEEQAEVSRWETTLEDCIEAGQLPHLTRPDGNGGTVLRIRHADLAAWCAQVPGGLAYPLPGPQAMPATDPALCEASQQEAPAHAVFELERITLEADMAALARERDAALQKQEAQRERAEALAGELKALKEAHSVALLRERQQRQQAEEVAGDLAGDHGRALQQEKQQRQRADELARELEAVKQAQQVAEAKAAKEWAALLAEVEEIKARHVYEQERLRAVADEYETLTDGLKRARAEMEQRQREDDADFSRLRSDHDRLRGDYERLQRQKWEQESDQARTLQELERTREELAKLRQEFATPVAEAEAIRERGALVRHVPALQAQEEAILQELLRLGYDPRQLPERQPGKPGAKAATKRAIGKAGMWSRPTVFEKAWKRLRTDGKIAGGE